MLAVPTIVGAAVISEVTFEEMATGTLATASHPEWEGMLEGNQGGQDPSDWKIVEGAGLTWVASDGGTIDGGNKHFEMRAVSNVSGRAFYNFANPLPTDIGQATSVYLRWVASFDTFEWISQVAGTGQSVWPVIRFNGSWQMRSVLKWREYACPDCTELRFMVELHDDVNLASGSRTVAFLEEKLGDPQPQTAYLVVTRYDFDAAGVLQGQAMWINPNHADMEAPDLVSNHQQPGYDTFVNPINSMDITTYGGTVRFDNIKIANSWDDVVPQPAASATWAGYPVSELGDVNTGSWMGYLNVSLGDYVWSYSLGQWLYITEQSVTEGGSWVYAFRY